MFIFVIFFIGEVYSFCRICMRSKSFLKIKFQILYLYSYCIYIERVVKLCVLLCFYLCTDQFHMYKGGTVFTWNYAKMILMNDILVKCGNFSKMYNLLLNCFLCRMYMWNSACMYVIGYVCVFVFICMYTQSKQTARGRV